MDPASFWDLPELPLVARPEITELHILLCKPPRPAAVRVKQGYKRLPPQLWAVAEFLASAAQTLEIEQIPACGMYQFFFLLLGQILQTTGVLSQSSYPYGDTILGLILRRNSVQSSNLACKQCEEADTKKTTIPLDGAMLLCSQKLEREAEDSQDAKQEAAAVDVAYAAVAECTVDADTDDENNKHESLATESMARIKVATRGAKGNLEATATNTQEEVEAESTEAGGGEGKEDASVGIRQADTSARLETAKQRRRRLRKERMRHARDSHDEG
jgi:hypothetical protein